MRSVCGRSLPVQSAAADKQTSAEPRGNAARGPAAAPFAFRRLFSSCATRQRPPHNLREYGNVPSFKALTLTQRRAHDRK